MTISEHLTDNGRTPLKPPLRGFRGLLLLLIYITYIMERRRSRSSVIWVIVIDSIALNLMLMMLWLMVIMMVINRIPRPFQPWVGWVCCFVSIWKHDEGLTIHLIIDDTLIVSVVIRLMSDESYCFRFFTVWYLFEPTESLQRDDHHRTNEERGRRNVYIYKYTASTHLVDRDLQYLHVLFILLVLGYRDAYSSLESGFIVTVTTNEYFKFLLLQVPFLRLRRKLVDW